MQRSYAVVTITDVLIARGTHRLCVIALPLGHGIKPVGIVTVAPHPVLQCRIGGLSTRRTAAARGHREKVAQAHQGFNRCGLLWGRRGWRIGDITLIRWWRRG